MDTLLLLLGIVGLAFFLFRPPRTQIIYVPMEPVKTRGELGCLPLIVVGMLALLALGIARL